MYWGPLEPLHAAAHRYLPRTAREFVKFAITGSLAFVVDFGTFVVLTRSAGWETTASILGYKIIPANLVSVLLAMLTVFLLNKFWTFRDPRREVIAAQGVRFFAFYAFTYVLNQVVTSFFAFYVPPLRAVFARNTDLVAKILAVGVITMVNFLGNKFVVFRRPSPATDASPSHTL